MGFESPTRAAKNHKSATLHSRRTLVEKELKTQVEQGKYVIASKKPAIISPLGTIPKDDGSGSTSDS